MFRRIKRWLTFRIEQMVMGGALARLAIIVALVLAVAVIAGLLVRLVAPGFESTGEAIWWAFLRLTDPGYLGEDEGLARKTLATAVTVLGYILFMGALIAILVQWLNQTMDRLEQGLTPVALKAHVVLLGWSSRTSGVLEEILASQGRIERFLRERGARRLRVAILTERAGADLMGQLRKQLGQKPNARWNARQIILRSGSPLEMEALGRIDFRHAAAVVIPAPDTLADSALDADARSVKTMLMMASALTSEDPSVPAVDEPPLMVLELQDTCYAPWLRSLYPGPMEVIGGDDVLVQLMVQSVRHPGLSHVFEEILSDQHGSQIYVREEPSLVGASIRQLAYAFPEGVLLGLARPSDDGFEALLNPPDDLRVETGDRVVVLATSYSDARPPDGPAAAPRLLERPPPAPESGGKRRVLILGWNHLVPTLIQEFAAHPRETFSIDIVSEVAASKRRKRLAAGEFPEERVHVQQHEFNFTVPAYLEDMEPAGYDNVLILHSEKLKTSSESDARTILAYLLLRQLTADEPGPHVLMELTDQNNSRLFERRLEGEHTEIVISSTIVSHMLARVALRRELRCVFDELFGPGGTDITFRHIADYGLTPGAYRFGELQQAVDARGDIALGLRRHRCRRDRDGGILLNPGRDETLDLAAADQLVVLSAVD